MNDLWEDRDIVPNPLASDSGVYAKKKQLDQVNSEIALLEKRLAESLDPVSYTHSPSPRDA